MLMILRFFFSEPLSQPKDAFLNISIDVFNKELFIKGKWVQDLCPYCIFTSCFWTGGLFPVLTVLANYLLHVSCFMLSCKETRYGVTT